MNYILLTQSRALLETTMSIEWHRSILRRLYQEQSGPFVVVTGDAGSDRKAIEVLESLPVDYRYKMFRLNGAIHAEQRINGVVSTFAAQWLKLDSLKRIPPKQVPLVRDRYMVQYCPLSTQCYGFIAAWSKTQGTQYTLRLARERGLNTNEQIIHWVNNGS